MSLGSRARDRRWVDVEAATDSRRWPERHEQLTCSRGLAQLQIQRARAWWSSRGLTERE